MIPVYPTQKKNEYIQIDNIRSSVENRPSRIACSTVKEVTKKKRTAGGKLNAAS